VKGAVIPAQMSEPVRMLEWTAEDDLLPLLYREIGCRTVEAFGLPGNTAVWVDEDGLFVDAPERNFRVEALVASYGLDLSGPVVGTAVLTGGPDG
jgi:hypothetical protein